VHAYFSITFSIQYPERGKETRGGRGGAGAGGGGGGGGASTVGFSLHLTPVGFALSLFLARGYPLPRVAPGGPPAAVLPLALTPSPSPRRPIRCRESICYCFCVCGRRGGWSERGYIGGGEREGGEWGEIAGGAAAGAADAGAAGDGTAVVVVVVVMVVVRRLGFGFRAGREATRVNKLPPEDGGGRESRGIVKARRQGAGRGRREIDTRFQSVA